MKLSNITLYGYEYHSASANNHGSASGKGNSSSTINLDVSNYNNLSIGNITGSGIVIAVFDENQSVTIASNTQIDISSYSTCKLQISVSYSGATISSGNSTSSSRSCTIDLLELY